MDLGGSRSAASVMAVADLAGNLGAFLAPVAVGAILDTWPGRWDIVLLMFAAVSGLGAVCWVFVDPDSQSDGSMTGQDKALALSRHHFYRPKAQAKNNHNYI